MTHKALLMKISATRLLSSYIPRCNSHIVIIGERVSGQFATSV